MAQQQSSLLRRYLPDVVFGANDGIITTFAIVAGAAGASLSHAVILILGFASLLADAFSMATSNYLSKRTPNEKGERPDRRGSARHGAATFVGFIVPGAVPLLAYLLPLAPEHQFPTAVGLTLLTLFVVGAGRAAATELRWLQAGVEMLAIGSVAALVAYGTGALGAMLVGSATAHAA